MRVFQTKTFAVPYKLGISIVPADIDYENGVIRTISTESSQVFKGTYDGGGYAIRNGVFTRAYDRVGLFGGCDGATLKRLHFVNCSVTQGKRGVGLVAGWANNTTIEDCHVDGGSVVSKWTAVGSIAGECKGVTIRNCSSNAAVTGSNGSAFSGAGGIVGSVSKVAAVIENCSFQGSVSGPASYAGGIAGDVSGAVRISGCSVLSGARIESESVIVGGIVGNAENPADAPGSVTSCSVTGATIASGDWGCAGIVARNYGVNVSSCQLSSTSVHAAGNNAAGVSAITKYSLHFTDCSVTSCTIVSDSMLAGGIVAELGYAGESFRNELVGLALVSTIWTAKATGYADENLHPHA